MKAPVRAVCLIIALTAAGLLTTQTESWARTGLKPGLKPLAVKTHSIPAFRIGRDQVQFGELTYIGGFEIEARGRHFGGFSGLVMLEGGTRLLSVSDNGLWFTARVKYNAAGRPVGLTGAALAPMLGSNGKPLPNKHKRDAEGLAMSRAGGKQGLLVSFERGHRILRFDFDPKFQMLSRGLPVSMPKKIRKLDYNKGLEALAEGGGGGTGKRILVAIAERAHKAEQDIPGWFRRKGKWRRFKIARQGRFQVTDAAFLPDGDLLLLERRFNLIDGIGMRLRRIAGSDLRKGNLISGTNLLTADFTYQIDNMEGLAVHRNAKGETIVTLISDDNRSILQRTLLLQFRLR